MPIMTILGRRDANSLEISKTSFNILAGEVRECIDDTGYTGILLSEHFVEIVNDILMFVAIDRLGVRTNWLAEDAIPPLQVEAQDDAIGSARPYYRPGQESGARTVVTT